MGLNSEIAELARAEILGVLQEGDALKGPVGRVLDVEDHVQHALDHLVAYRKDGKLEDLTHALTRCAMEVWRQ